MKYERFRFSIQGLGYAAMLRNGAELGHVEQETSARRSWRPRCACGERLEIEPSRWHAAAALLAHTVENLRGHPRLALRLELAGEGIESLGVGE